MFLLDKSFLGQLKINPYPVADAKEFSEGCVRTLKLDLFPPQSIILWRQVKGTCLALLLEADENALLASNFLSLFLLKTDDLGAVII